MPQFAPGLRRVLAARKPAAPKQKLELRQEWACVPLRAPFLAPFRIEKRQPLFNRVLVVVVDTTMSHLPASAQLPCPIRRAYPLALKRADNRHARACLPPAVRLHQHST